MVVQLTRQEPTNAPTAATKQRSGSLSVALVSAMVALLVVLRHLGTKPLWRDEAISVSVATRPVTGILWVLPHHDANAGLYYLLLHGWIQLGSSGATWARGLSALAFVATAGLASWAVSRWLGWRAGAACGLLVATNPFLVYYGQEARPYALAVCLAVGSTMAMFWRGTRPSPRAYVAVTLVLLYIDLFAVIFVIAAALAVLAVHRLRSEPVPPVLTRCWAAIAAVSAPLALVMILGQRGQISWLSRPDFAVLGQTVTAMSSGWVGLGLVAVLALAAVTAAAAIDRPALATLAVGDDRDQLIVAALACSFVLPPALLWALSQAVPSYVDRYVICSAVAMVGLVAAGLDTVRRVAGDVVALALLAALVILGGQQIAKLEAGPFKVDNAPAARAFITSQAQAGDVVAYAGGGLQIVMEASGKGAGGRSALPADITLATGGEAFRQHDLYARQVSAADLQLRLAGVQRVWMVTDPRDDHYPPNGPFGELRPMVTTTFAPGGSGSFGAIDVTLYTRRAR